jgi:hypothetical protein
MSPFALQLRASESPLVCLHVAYRRSGRHCARVLADTMRVAGVALVAIVVRAVAEGK